jgi:hypothetical protein
MQMWMTHGKEGGSYEQGDETKRSPGRTEATPGMIAGDVVAESLDETVHCCEIRRFPGAVGSDSAI